MKTAYLFIKFGIRRLENNRSGSTDKGGEWRNCSIGYSLEEAQPPQNLFADTTIFFFFQHHHVDYWGRCEESGGKAGNIGQRISDDSAIEQYHGLALLLNILLIWFAYCIYVMIY